MNCIARGYVPARLYLMTTTQDTDRIPSDRLVPCHCGDGTCMLCDDNGMRDSADVLDDFAPVGSVLEHDPDAPSPFAVWCDGDIIGSGDTASEALADARHTVRCWESNS